ncbi:hypothetical protein M5K25_007199 [Dendrobium thyrsiflorum]|uniref:Uncharacterized protein n=1 Tax=Dendrobium thyrsiflorum TaxID=117978 RepID=A0ABD0VKJ9_DENTH
MVLLRVRLTRFGPPPESPAHSFCSLNRRTSPSWRTASPLLLIQKKKNCPRIRTHEPPKPLRSLIRRNRPDLEIFERRTIPLQFAHRQANVPQSELPFQASSLPPFARNERTARLALCSEILPGGPTPFNLQPKRMGTDVKTEEREWQAHELEPNPRPLKRRFVFWYTRRTKVHPPPPLPALEATLGVPPPKPQDVLFYSKVHGPVKRRKVSAIRQFPPGCGPGSGAATSEKFRKQSTGLVFKPEKRPLNLLTSTQRPEGKMTGKLIFSLSDSMNLSYNPFADGSVIKFGKGFEDLQLSVSGPEFTVVPPTEIADKKPVLEFTLGCGSQTAPVAPKPSVFSRIEQPGQDQKLKSVVIADSSVPFSAPSQFEIGSSSSLPEIMTKTQRRNRNRRMKRRMEKLEKKEHIPPTSPHLSGSRFNPLSTAEGEEDARIIARSTPTTDRKTAVKPSEEKEVHIGNMVRAIVRECADSHSQSREGFLRNMKRMISEKIEEETSKQKSVGTRVVSQSRSRNNKRTFKPVAVSALTDGYPREPRRSHRKTDSIVLTDSSVKPRGTQYVPRKVSRQLSPSATPPRESRKTQRYSQTHSSPRVDRHHPTVSNTPSHHEVERLEAPNQPPPASGEKEVREFKEKATSPVVASPEMPIGEERKEEEKVEIDTIDSMDCERYVPVDPHYISGRSIEEMLGELKESIKNLDDKEALDLEVDQDDMLDDEIADVMMVDTRRSSQEEQVEGVGIQDVVVEEGVAPDLTQRLLQQLKQKDDQITNMGKKIEEMMATMASFQCQGPLPPRAQAESSQPESVQVVGKKQVVEVMEEHQQDLETKASQAKEIKQMVEKQSSLDSKKLKPQKIFEKKSGTVSAVEKGKQPMKVQAENPPPQFYNQQYQRPQFQPQFQPPFQPQPPPPQYPPPQRPPLWIQPQFNQQRPYLTPDEKRENWEKFNTLIDSDSTWDIVLSRSSKKLLNKLYSSSLQESSGAQKPLQVDLIVPEDSIEMTLPSELKEARVSQAPIVQKKEDTSDCFVSSSSVVRDVSSSKVVFSADGEAMILNPLTLDDFCFVLRDDMKSMEKDSVYILSISDSDVTDDLKNMPKNDSLNDQFNFEELKHSLGYHSDSDVLALDLQGTPICIEAEMSDSENVTELKPELAKVEVDGPPITSSEEIVEIKLRSGKVLAPQASSGDKGKQIGENINKRPKFEIPLEHDSDEDKIQANIEDDSGLSTYEKLKGYAKTLALTPLSQDSLAGLTVKVSPALSDDCKTAKFIPSTSKNIETDVNIDDPFMNEIVELPFDWYPYGVKNLIEQGVSPLLRHPIDFWHKYKPALTASY